MGIVRTADCDGAAARLAAGVASYGLETPFEDIMGAARGSAGAALAGQAAMYLRHVAFELSLSRVAIAFRRDRSTVAHACHLIEDRRDEPTFDRWIAALEAMLRDAPAPGLRS